MNVRWICGLGGENFNEINFTSYELEEAIPALGVIDFSVQLRDLRGQMQQVGKIEDMAAGEAPKKTGVERRAPTDEERRLIKLVNEAKKKGVEFLEGAAKQSGAKKTNSGIVIRTITPGNGPSPGPMDIVKVHYEGKLPDGTVFDSSIKRGEPAEFPLNQVVPCWTEALQQMKKGEKAQVVCPSQLAYGDRGSPPAVPPGATLSFEVELLDFHKP